MSRKKPFYALEVDGVVLEAVVLAEGPWLVARGLEIGHVPLGRAAQFHKVKVDAPRYGRFSSRAAWRITHGEHLGPVARPGDVRIGPFKAADADRISRHFGIACGLGLDFEDHFRASPAWRALVRRVAEDRRVATPQVGRDTYCPRWAEKALADADALAEARRARRDLQAAR